MIWFAITAGLLVVIGIGTLGVSLYVRRSLRDIGVDE